MPEFDVVMVGAGHNGLTCACYLALAGLKVCVLERRPIPGGAAVTEELWPGIQISRASYVPGLMDQIVEDLELRKYGLQLGPVDPQYFAPFPSGRHLFTYRSDEQCVKELEKFSTKDAAAFPKFSRFLREFSEMVEPLLLTPPPDLHDLLGFFDGSELEEVARSILLTSCADLLRETFESPEVQGAYAMEGVLNTSMGPDTVGTSYILALAMGQRGYDYAVGGTGAVSKSLAAHFVAHGGTIHTDSAVRTIRVVSGRAVGVELADGRTVDAPIVVSNADPRRTFLDLLEPGTLDADFSRRVSKLRAFGTSLKLNIVLKEPLDFRALPGTTIGPQHRALTDVGPSIDYIQKAYDDARWGRIPKEPPLSMFCQTAWDATMAPPGIHTLSVIAKYNPYTLENGSWTDRKDESVENALSVLEGLAPGARKNIVHLEALTPVDLENLIGFTEGNVTHLDQTPNQMLSFRPLVGWSHYRTPVPGLYLCGAGTHPGGGVKGAPGHNAAHVILEDLSRPSSR
ncbi:MAG: NAD(P)/FAD-dependent oxidoreductase [Thermoplasmata archaeon]|nr:NAD(P)/FAD-dependent oxidoreductase [Thermoplasmata archaeon]